MNPQMRNLPETRPRSFLFTLYGDYVQPLAPYGARIGSLVRLGEVFGISSAALRTAVSRMTSEGWLVAFRDRHRSVYKLTDRGQHLIQEGVQRIYRTTTASWDGRWLLVCYSVPERKRNQRDRIRSTLSFLGFGSAVNGVYVSARDLRREVMELVKENQVVDEVTLHWGELAWPIPDSRLVERAWSLKDLTKRYSDFNTRTRVSLPDVRAKLRRRGVSDQDAFRRRFLLTHEYRHLLFGDPDLPAELLPSDWAGLAAKNLFLEYNRILKPAADRFFKETVNSCNKG
jgi:phenylacetic acid degradation operon negative regulatory protein